MPISVADLPYGHGDLEPHMSERTVRFHFEKHHKGYARKVNEAIEGTGLADKPLEEIIRTTTDDPEQAYVFNNAAQVWNHDLFWHSMSPNNGGQPGETLAPMIDQAFGGIDGFRKAFVDSATKRFGSGYAWLVIESGEMKVMSTANADTPLTDEKTAALLCCDVWEHAYYLDYQNERGKFVETFVNHLLDWDAAEKRLAAAPLEAIRKAA